MQNEQMYIQKMDMVLVQIVKQVWSASTSSEVHGIVRIYG